MAGNVARRAKFIAQGIKTSIAAGIGMLLVGVPALWIAEMQLRHVDRVNQEQLHWTCNGNGIGNCSLFGRA